MDKDSQKTSSEEIDLGQVFNAIGRLFDRFFRFIGSIFKGIFVAIISLLKIIIDNILVIALVLGLAAILGFFTEKQKKPLYEASMLVKPHFDSKYQLISSIDYFNSLLNEGNYNEVAEIFRISQANAHSLKAFEVETGPETKNGLLKDYDAYLKTLDSTRANTITYDDFVENRDIYSSELFFIKVKSHQRDIFRRLEGGIDSIFSNSYSIEQKKKRDLSLNIKKTVFEENLERMDSLQSVYLDVIQKEAGNGSLSLGVGVLPVQQEKVLTREYDVFQNQMKMRDSIKVIEQLKIQANEYHEVLSRFPEVGKKYSKLYLKHWILFPCIAFFGLCVLYIITATFRYVKNYEG
ncbi:MAG TPA: hypothetical protein VKZ98_02335 [Aquaticitalea sp.]|nr:hypothetical protein [Aquaticitalea sp.]